MAWSPPLGPQFEREHGVTEADWLATLRGAVGGHPLTLGEGRAQVAIGPAGRLELRWQILPPRVIALMRMPRLQVAYRFSGLSAEQQAGFLHRFDLFMQRGGG